MLQRLARRMMGAALLSICFSIHATEWFSTNANVSFELPSDPAWQQVKPARNEAKLVLQNTNGTATMFFAAFEKKHDEKELSEKLAEDWERGYFRKGNIRKLSGEFFNFKGKRAYKVTDEEIINGGKQLGVAIIWLNDGRYREIVAWKVDGDPLQDNVIKAFVDSMIFLPKVSP